jgi:nucleotide-binding universal stress UspA family protein
MTVKSILVPLDGSDASFDVLDTALIVANRFDAKIKGIHVRSKSADLPYELDYVSDDLKRSVVEEAERISRETASVIQDQFVDYCAKHDLAVGESLNDAGVRAVWHDETGSVSEVLMRHGRLSDVIAAARPARMRGRLLRSPLGERMESVLLRAGRPVLMVPPRWTAHKVERAAFAWNESLEATRALAMTMPWLTQMDEVSVIVSRKREPVVSHLLEYLSLHGVRPKVRFLPDRTRSVAQAILECCSNNSVEMLVVGGFSHARSRELVFGGVTRYLLENANVITVMVH